MPVQTATGFSVIDTYNFIREDMQASSETDYEEELLDLEHQQAIPQFSFSSSSSSFLTPTTTTAATTTITTNIPAQQHQATPYSSPAPSPYSSPAPSPAPLSPHHCPPPPPSPAQQSLQQQQQQQQVVNFGDTAMPDLTGTSFLEELMMGVDDPSFLTFAPLQPVNPTPSPQLPLSTTTLRMTYVAEAVAAGCTVVQKVATTEGIAATTDQQLLHTDLTELYDLDKQMFCDDAGSSILLSGNSMKDVDWLKPNQQGLESSLVDLGPVGRSEQENLLNLFENIGTDILQDCKQLSISPNPKDWSAQDTQSWVQHLVGKSQKADDCSASLALPGAVLCQKSLEEFRWISPNCGDMLHQQLEMWSAIAPSLQSQNAAKAQQPPRSLAVLSDVQLTPLSSATPSSYLPPSVSPAPSMDSLCSHTQSSSQSSTSSDAEMFWGQESSEEDMFQNSNANLSPPELLPKSSKTSSSKQHSGRPGKQIRLWEFLKELLEDNDSSMKWLDRTRGIFKIEDSTRVSRMWGTRKNHPAMNYDKLSRSVRQYYKKGIIKKTTQTRRLVYQFCERYL